MNRFLEILREYDHLLEHDTHLDCSTSSFSCMFRKYGMTLGSLAVFTAGSVAWFAKKVKEVEDLGNRKRI